MSWLRDWRPLLRLAWRDARRARGRSALVLVMIALPVLGVVAADVVISTARLSGAEALDRRLGAADAVVDFQSGRTQVDQDVDPERTGYSGEFRGRDLPDLDDVRAVWGGEVRAITWGRSVDRVVTEDGMADVALDRLDVRDPLTAGLWQVEEGRAAEADGELVVNAHLADQAGVGVGDQVELADGERYRVVGIGRHGSVRAAAMAVGLDRRLDEEGALSTRLLVDAGGPVDWSEVRALNAIGATVISRSVLLDPPPRSEIPEGVRTPTIVDSATVAVAVLIVVMALMEVVLLAGPAFAVGARRQSRDLALMAATGGTPSQARRVILASGLVLGGLGAVLGVVLGLVVAVAALPFVQRFSSAWLGPFEVPVLHVAGIAVFGLLSAFLAAVVPAWIASRQDVVAVLAGRRADRPAGLRSPALGLLLLAGGVGTATYGALNPTGSELLIAASAIPTVLGMILLIPLVLAGLARLSRHLPLVLRYAVRDAARHRTRTVPAVAAVAATVAGVVALGVAVSSDTAQNRATYSPAMPLGVGVIASWDGRDRHWDRFATAVAETAPDAVSRPVAGVPDSSAGNGHRQLALRSEGARVPLQGWGSGLGASVVVDDGSHLGNILTGVDQAQLERAQEVLGAGGAVVFTSLQTAAEEVTVAVRRHRPDDGRNGRGSVVGRATVEAAYVVVGTDLAPVQAVLSPQVAEALDLPVRTVGLELTGDVSPEEEERLRKAVAAITEHASVYVERGFQNDDEVVILLLVLGALGAVLMLGGTLTATFLALSDARPDLATLAAVGASPGSRRGVATSYALAVGLVGASLGVLVGFVPGIAITYPLTGPTWGSCVLLASGACEAPTEAVGPSNYLDVPWLLVGSLVVALPLLTALIVGAATRSRLPLVARLA